MPDDWAVWAFSDPHGVATGLEAALVDSGLVDRDLRWAAAPGTALVGCGDYVDRGTDSRGVVEILRRLGDEAAAAGGAVVLTRGNHEHLLHGLVTGAAQSFDLWLAYGGRATLESFGLGALDPVDPRASVARIEDAAPGIIGWLDALPHAVRWRDALFVHGGLVPGHGPDDLARTTLEHLWIRETFFGTPWRSGAFAGFEAAGIERVIFGHTPQPDGTRLFHGGRSLAIDTNACGNPQMAHDARRLVTLVELGDGGGLDGVRSVVVDTLDAPDGRRP
ncbi:MAG: metallophosphoesterase family protein [Candidatus Limnocylindrales bacterium]